MEHFMNRSLCFFRPLSVLLLAAVALVAQNSGVISGAVTDSTQGVIPDAQVTIVNAGTGVTVWRGVTNESGVYRAPQLQAAQYNVAVEKHASMNVTLQPGGTTESVTVVGASEAQLATDTASLGSVITPSQVQNLP